MVLFSRNSLNSEAVCLAFLWPVHTSGLAQSSRMTWQVIAISNIAISNHWFGREKDSHCLGVYFILQTNQGSTSRIRPGIGVRKIRIVLEILRERLNDLFQVFQ